MSISWGNNTHAYEQSFYLGTFGRKDYYSIESASHLVVSDCLWPSGL